MENQSKGQALYNRITLALLMVFVLECVIGGSGRWLAFGPLSIRMVLFGICFALTLPNILRHFRELITRSNVIVTLLLGVYLLIAAVIGIRNGNRMNFVWADLTGFMALALLPGFLATIVDQKLLQKVTGLVFLGTVLLAAITVALHFLLAFASDAAINAINRWLNDHTLGGMASMDTGLQRIYLRSQIFLQVGLLIGIGKAWQVSGWRRWLILALEGIIAYACLISYTRGFWLGFAISAVILLVLEPTHWQKYLTAVGVVAAVVVAMFLLSWLTYGKPVAAQELAGRFNPDLLTNVTISSPSQGDTPTEAPEEPEDADEAAVMIREESLLRLYELIGQRPIFGSGLGTNLDGIRDDGKTEYTYLDMLMKLGAVGFLLFMGTFFLPVVQLLKQRLARLRKGECSALSDAPAQNSILLAAYLGVAITSYVNPFLINPMGILLVLILTAAAKTAKCD